MNGQSPNLRVPSPVRGVVSVLCIIPLWITVTSFWKVEAQSVPQSTNIRAGSELSSAPAPDGIWEDGVGEGFRSTTQSLSPGVGVLGGLEIFGSCEAHDLAVASLEYGHMLKGVLGRGHWYQGNPEIRVELFTGAQFSPSKQWLVGLTPHLRYNFATGTRFIPFVDGGAGVTATGIGPPDLSGTFEFNLQAGGGVWWFLKDNLALGIEEHYIHWSCAGISHPNLGLNGLLSTVGLTFFF
jgi:lipid A 3-O-deacylase